MARFFGGPMSHYLVPAAIILIIVLNVASCILYVVRDHKRKAEEAKPKDKARVRADSGNQLPH